MSLTDDQRALLQLILEQGQGYEDLSGVLGTATDTVRERARAALAALGGSDPDRNVGLTDFLLGQADPIGRADAVRHLGEDAADHELATRISTQLRVLAPAAELPALPPPPGGSRRRSRTPAGRPADERPRRLALPTPADRLSAMQARVLAAAATGALILLIAILAVVGAFGGQDSDAGEAAEPSSGLAERSGIPDGEELVTVELAPPGTGDASGSATIGQTATGQPYMDLQVTGLSPAPAGESYIAWFLVQGESGYPLTPVAIGDDGSLADRFAIPQIVTPVIMRARRIDVSLAADRRVQRTIAEAIRGEDLLVERQGETVLRGRIPAPATGAGGNDGPRAPEG